jgi:hypothetical protein
MDRDYAAVTGIFSSLKLSASDRRIFCFLGGAALQRCDEAPQKIKHGFSRRLHAALSSPM